MKALLIACVGLVGAAAYGVNAYQTEERVSLEQSIERDPHATFTALSKNLKSLQDREATYAGGRHTLTFTYREKLDEQISVSALTGGKPAMVFVFHLEPQAGGAETLVRLDVTVHSSPLTKGRPKLEDRVVEGMERALISIARAIERKRPFDVTRVPSIRFRGGPLDKAYRNALDILVEEGKISEATLARMAREASD